MSNYKAKAKRPDSDKWEEVEMLDNYFGSHVYGVKFPNGDIINAIKCEIKKEEEVTLIDNEKELERFLDKISTNKKQEFYCIRCGRKIQDCEYIQKKLKKTRQKRKK